MECKKELHTIEKKLDILGEITVVKCPSSIRVFGKNCIISGTNFSGTYTDVYECSIIDPIKNKEIKKFNGPYLWDSEVSPDNKRAVLFHANKAILYNMKKETEEWSIANRIHSVTFSLAEKAVFLSHGILPYSIIKYNYKTKACNDIPMDKYCKFIAMHPKENSICIANISNLSLYNVDESTLTIKKEITLPKNECLFCHYSAGGSYIASGDKSDIFIIDSLREDKDWYHLQPKDNEWFADRAFHPNSSVFVTLSQSVALQRFKKLKVNFWDIKKRQPICTLFGENLDEVYEFDFYHKGSAIIFQTKKKCLRVAVPFEVIYQSDTKERCLFSLLVLKQIKDRGELNQDSVYCCIKSLLEQCKR
jgi:hypothetical protein